MIVSDACLDAPPPPPATMIIESLLSDNDDNNPDDVAICVAPPPAPAYFDVSPAELNPIPPPLYIVPLPSLVVFDKPSWPTFIYNVSFWVNDILPTE